MQFADCELAIMRMAIDKTRKKVGRRVLQSPETQQIIRLVESWLRTHPSVCYGGTAVNAMLPIKFQFYNRDVELPDYDWYSPIPMDDAKDLCDLFYTHGLTEVEAKAGAHHGTYKVFVNFLPVADITLMPREIFDVLLRESVQLDGIHYAPPNFLRMAMYVELSRPMGDTSRWEKVLQRLNLLNTYHPIELAPERCQQVSFQRNMDISPEEQAAIYDIVRNTFIDLGVVFFGGYALSLYAQYMPDHAQHPTFKIADFDVLANNPERTVAIVELRLREAGIRNTSVVAHDAVGEIVPRNLEILVGKETIAFVYQPIACHSYNRIRLQDRYVKIATIDTMLSFYLAFLYTDRPYYNAFLDRIVCLAQFLFEVQQTNRLEQRGLLRRFTPNCIGHQTTKEDIRMQKNEMFRILSRRRTSKRRFDEWFLRYRPADEHRQTRRRKRKRNTSSSSSMSYALRRRVS